MKYSKRRKMIFLAILLNVVVLFSLIAFYLVDAQDIFNSKIVPDSGCASLFSLDNCLNDETSKPSDGTLPPPVETSSIDENVILTVQPKLIDSYLSNPGIGWQYDANVGSSVLPETVAYSTRKEIAWNILNPIEDVYDWTALDRQLSRAVSNAEQYSFRVYTMAGESFGGHKVPQWVLDKGAVILPSGEPDYSNCVYQEEWSKFVQALIEKYDGNPNIAFIDISGYGNFNEWGWQDGQTQWDNLWEASYANNAANSYSMTSIDSQARRRLVDLFIGGVFERHQCRSAERTLQVVDYEYSGFTSTQLVMPYAGIVQSTQYVFARNPNIGFRHDSLGRINNTDVYKVSGEISQIWKNAPIIYEFSKPNEFDVGAATSLLETTHASLVHNNEHSQSINTLQKLLLNVGYRYFLKNAQFTIQPFATGDMEVIMNWQNVGSAPSYPRVGQEFELHLLIENQNKKIVADYKIPADISLWMPAESPAMSSPEYKIHQTMKLPDSLEPGTYTLFVSIIEVANKNPVNLAFLGNDGSGKYKLEKFDVYQK